MVHEDADGILAFHIVRIKTSSCCCMGGLQDSDSVHAASRNMPPISQHAAQKALLQPHLRTAQPRTVYSPLHPSRGDGFGFWDRGLTR